MPKLVVLSEGFTGRSCELKAEPVTVGRLEDNTFCIPEPSVSSHHCVITMHGNDVVVKDLNSTNGTFISGNQIIEAVLKPGQILRLGNVQMRLEADQPAAPSKKLQDHTVAIPQGIKPDDLETGAVGKTAFDAKDAAFRKKGNRANIIFMIIGIVLALVVIGLLIYTFRKTGENPPAP
jgi:hypothetical protein